MKYVSAQLTPIFVMLVIGTSAFVYLNCAATPNPDHLSAYDLGKINQVDVSELTPAELKRFDEIINREVSPCGNEYSLAQTLLNPNMCPLSMHATEYVLSLIKLDYNAEEVSTRYVQRYASIKGQNIEIGDSPSMGAETPTITIVTFSDFQCPFCAKAAKQVEKIARSYPNDILLVFKHFPLSSIHPESMLGARATYAAHQQNQFWQMHDTLFARGRAGYDPDRIRVMAEGLGMDPDKFENDLASVAAKSAIEADMALGKKLGVNGTPKFFVNGRILDGGLKNLEDRIREEFLRNKYLKKK